MQVVPNPLRTIQQIKEMNVEGYSHCKERREGSVSALRQGQGFGEIEQRLAEADHRPLSKAPLWLLQNYAKDGGYQRRAQSKLYKTN